MFLVRIILGRLWVSMVVHTAIVDGMDLHAKWENRAEGGNVVYSLLT